MADDVRTTREDEAAPVTRRDDPSETARAAAAGAVVGGALGAVVGGPAGALAGAAVGSVVGTAAERVASGDETAPAPAPDTFGGPIPEEGRDTLTATAADHSTYLREPTVQETARLDDSSTGAATSSAAHQHRWVEDRCVECGVSRL